MAAADGGDHFLRLIDFVGGPPDAAPWSADELKLVWEHLLDSPVITVLAAADQVAALQADELCRAATPPIVSFRDALHKSGPTDLLNLIASAAAVHLGNPHPVIPSVVALALFNLTMLQVRFSTAERITISDKELSVRADWLSRLEWLDQATQSVVQAHRKELPPATDG